MRLPLTAERNGIRYYNTPRSCLDVAKSIE